MPQPPPVEQEARLQLIAPEDDLSPTTRDNWRCTFLLPQAGQTTSSALDEVITSSSKSSLQSSQINP